MPKNANKRNLLSACVRVLFTVCDIDVKVEFPQKYAKITGIDIPERLVFYKGVG